jgi:CubicO group peptidase (beta-lactamase class C family)
MHHNFSRMKQFVIFVGLILFAAQFAYAQGSVASVQTAEQIAAKVDEYMSAAVKVDDFSGSVLVARDGQPIFNKSYGLASIELGAPNTPQTVFRIASISKPFTATAIMILQERGKLNVGDSICKYLADCPAAWQPITIKHLLTHTSGIPDYLYFPDFQSTIALPVTHEKMIATFRNKSLGFAPGEKFAYNNSGYYLLAVIIERASGKAYAEFLRENIFAPLGMKQTGDFDNREIIENRAAGYSLKNDRPANAVYFHPSQLLGTGSLWSTTEDLLLFDQALYTEKLLKNKTLAEMLTPFKTDYGYGWQAAPLFNRRLIMHGGDTLGFMGFLQRFTDDRVTIVLLSNKGYMNILTLARDLPAIVFGEKYQLPQNFKAVFVDAKILQQYVGEYQLSEKTVFTITLENGKLMIQNSSNTRPKGELFAESETRFRRTGVDATFTFERDTISGRVTALSILNVNDETRRAPKIK